MKEILQLGSVVFSKKGRDKGNFFVVVAIANEQNVLLCDGSLHKLNKPKKKNTKHIKQNGVVLESLQAKFLQNKKVFDSEVHSALRVFNEQIN